jgi:hypothetical protein
LHRRIPLHHLKIAADWLLFFKIIRTYKFSADNRLIIQRETLALPPEEDGKALYDCAHHKWLIAKAADFVYCGGVSLKSASAVSSK